MTKDKTSVATMILKGYNHAPGSAFNLFSVAQVSRRDGACMSTSHALNSPKEIRRSASTSVLNLVLVVCPHRTLA